MTFLGLVLCALVSQCWAASTIDILASDPRMNTLVDLVTKAGLVNAINSGTFTIFAPTDAAFSALDPALLASLGNDVNALANVLKYHVVAGSIHSSDAKNELTVTTLNGQEIRFNIYSHNNVVTIQGSTITEFDKQASNGVIHVIEKVMLPPQGDIVDIVGLTSDVSTLLSLVQQAGIANALKGDALTVFAPTNAAFARLSPSIASKITSNNALLAEILEYHVVPHTEYSAGLYNREYLRTLDKHHDRIALHTSSGGVRVNTNGNVVKADIGASNGVIHLIDHVLIPARYYLSLIIGKK